MLIMAGGTGGHIFPAMSIAEKLRVMGVHVEWLGSTAGLEVQILGKTSIPLHLIAARGLRGKGFRRLVAAPLMILQATLQALKIIKEVDPDCVLGMGGFVTGPGGVAARLRRKKLLIHEQNAVPGITNKLLALLADRILQAFPGTFPHRTNVQTVGNPVRRAIADIAMLREFNLAGPLRLLVLGGSQGALAINEVVPGSLSDWPTELMPHVIHQTGRNKLVATTECYERHGLKVGNEIRVVEFIDDMAEAYQWADLVICRSGASTVAELAATGLPSLLVPYPYHRDQQQLKNARWLAGGGAATIIEQKYLKVERIRDEILALVNDRKRLRAMSEAARAIAILDADARIGEICLETAHG